MAHSDLDQLITQTIEMVDEALGDLIWSQQIKSTEVSAHIEELRHALFPQFFDFLQQDAVYGRTALGAILGSTLSSHQNQASLKSYADTEYNLHLTEHFPNFLGILRLHTLNPQKSQITGDQIKYGLAGAVLAIVKNNDAPIPLEETFLKSLHKADAVFNIKAVQMQAGTIVLSAHKKLVLETAARALEQAQAYTHVVSNSVNQTSVQSTPQRNTCTP